MFCQNITYMDLSNNHIRLIQERSSGGASCIHIVAVGKMLWSRQRFRGEFSHSERLESTGLWRTALHFQNVDQCAVRMYLVVLSDDSTGSPCRRKQLKHAGLLLMALWTSSAMRMMWSWQLHLLLNTDWNLLYRPLSSIHHRSLLAMSRSISLQSTDVSAIGR